jgi:hypothetical protein
MRHNDELQRTSDGNAAGSPLNSVFGGRTAKPEKNVRLASLGARIPLL